MKKIYTLLIVFIILPGTASFAQDTLLFQFNNALVVEGPTNDTLIFDLEVRSNTSSTYLTAVGPVISFSQAVFGDFAEPVVVERLELTAPTGYNFNTPSASASINSFSSSFYAWAIFPPHGGNLNIAFLGNVTTEFKGLIRYKMLITGSGNAGIDFDSTNMSGQQFFVLTSGGSAGTVYDEITLENDLLNFPTTPAVSDLMISEIADPTDSNGDFIEIYNSDDQTVNFTSSAWFLTFYDGVDYDSIQLSGTLDPGETFVIGGPNFTTAYPGKTADQTASFIESNGTGIFYLTAVHSYDYGTLVDIFNANTAPFTGKHAVRPFPVTDPNTSFDPTEWKISAAATMDMTPGSHRITLTWDGTSNDTWRDTANWTPSYVPDVGHNARIPQDVAEQPVIYTGSAATCHNFIVGEVVVDQIGEGKKVRLPIEEQ